MYVDAISAKAELLLGLNCTILACSFSTLERSMPDRY